MFKVCDNNTPKLDFSCVLRCACNHTPFLPSLVFLLSLQDFIHKKCPKLSFS